MEVIVVNQMYVTAMAQNIWVTYVKHVCYQLYFYLYNGTHHDHKA